MKNTENYGYTLKKLLCFTGIKFVVLSKSLGYDVSYISKWCHNIKIPTFKNIGMINEKAAIIFSDQIIEENRIKEFYELFHIDETLDSNNEMANEMLKNHIYNLLDVSYKKSENDLFPRNDKKQDETKVVVGKNQVIAFIRELITTTVKNSTTDIELLSTVDICKTTSNINLDIIDEYELNGIKMNAKVAIDVNEFEINPDFYLWRTYVILNKKWNVEFEFFDNKNIDKLNIISIRNKFAIVLSLDSDGLIEVATVITDKETVNTIYDKTISKFKISDILVRAVETEVLEQGGYRTDFYSSNEFQFVSTKGFEFLLPTEIVSDIIHKTYSKGSNYDVSFFIKKLQITWEERFEKSKINFIILKSALMKYIEEGEIFYTDIKYNLSIEQRKKHIFKIVEAMKKNDNIKITILNDELLNYDGNFFKISVYVNDKKAFFKKDLEHVGNMPLVVYTITNEKLVNYINQYLSFIRSSDLCVEYGIEEVELALEKYGKMFLRMLEVKNCNKVN